MVSSNLLNNQEVALFDDIKTITNNVFEQLFQTNYQYDKCFQLNWIKFLGDLQWESNTYKVFRERNYVHLWDDEFNKINCSFFVEESYEVQFKNLVITKDKDLFEYLSINCLIENHVYLKLRNK